MSTMPNGAAPPTWKIVSQTPGYDTAAGSGLVKGVTIGFVVNGAINGSVFVPDAQFTVANVRSAVAAEAEKLAAIQALTHESPAGS